MKFLTCLYVFTFCVSAYAGVDPSNNFKLGDGTNSNKKIQANTASATKPDMRWNDSAQKWQVCNNGSTCVDIDSGAGNVTTISASNIDWSQGTSFVKTLSASIVITFSNQKAGQVIIVRLTNTASNYTVTWPGSVLWSGGTMPTETIGAKSDVITLFYDGTNTYGSSVQNF